MSRRLPDLDLPAGAVAAYAVTFGVIASALGIAVVKDRTGEPVKPPIARYEDEPGWDCRLHGNRVCGMEGPGVYTAPDGGTYTVVPGGYVYTGPMSWTYQGGTVSVPGLAEDITDGCADQPDDLLDCVGAVIGQRMEHRP